MLDTFQASCVAGGRSEVVRVALEESESALMLQAPEEIGEIKVVAGRSQ